MSKKHVRTPFHAIQELSKLDYTDVYFFCGSDRFGDFNAFRNYVRHPDPEKSLDLDNFVIIEIKRQEGEVSASQMKEFAKNGDYVSFRDNLPENASEEISKEIYLKTKEGLK